MVRKSVPQILRPDLAYASSLPAHTEPSRLAPSPVATGASVPAEPRPAPTAAVPRGYVFGPTEPGSTQIDVRVTALARQEAGLLGCGVDPRQVIRAALRAAVKRWELSSDYSAPSPAPRVRHPGWIVRTSVAVPAAVFDRLLVAQDPLGVCSRWSLTRAQLEPLVWAEIDALLLSLQSED